MILLSFLSHSPAQAGEKNIFGEDNRTPMLSSEYPWSAIGKLKSNTGHCSASLIGQKLVLTNAHCVAKQSGFKFYPNYKSGKGKSYSVKKVLMVGGTKFPQDVPRDWAILELKEAAGKEYGYLKIAEISTRQTDLILAGYSGDFKNGKTAGVHTGCSIHGFDKGRVLHDCDMTKGASGSPILQKISENEYQIIALHSAQAAKKGGRRYKPGVAYSRATTNIAVRTELFYQIVQKIILEN